MIFKIVPNSMKTLWGFQRFRKSEGPCMCWSRRAIGPQMLFPASPPARHIVQCLASVERPSTLDHQGNWRVRLWVIQAPSTPAPAGCLGLAFLFLCSLVPPLCGWRSQACVYQCSSFLTVLVTSLARDKLEVFEYRDLEILCAFQIVYTILGLQDSGWFQGLHPSICTQDT